MEFNIIFREYKKISPQTGSPNNFFRQENYIKGYREGESGNERTGTRTTVISATSE